MDKFYNNEASKLSYDESVSNIPNGSPYARRSDETFDINYILSRIDKIHQDSEHIMSAISTISKIESGSPGDYSPGNKAEAISAVVEAREATNQKLLDLYTKMYEDMSNSKSASSNDVEMKRIEKVAEILAGTDLSEVDESFYEFMSGLAGTRRK